DGLYDYRVRLQAYAGQRYVKVTYAITNFRVAEKWKVPPILNFEVGAKVELPGDHAGNRSRGRTLLASGELAGMGDRGWGGRPAHGPDGMRDGGARALKCALTASHRN
ncbi:MAG: hypothetical protein PHR35_22815, partial [Kiritimatiellae bacterium]|nr:hypothetical protein [Kiritimatiellia bacterium]